MARRRFLSKKRVRRQKRANKKYNSYAHSRGGIRV